MTKKTQKQILFERMNSVAGMPLNENYPWGAKDDPAAPWNEPEYPENGEEYEPDPDERHDRDYGDMDEGEGDSPKRWNNVSVWINQTSEEDMKNAGFEFDPKGNSDLFYNGKKVGFVSNFNGVMLDDEYVDELVPLFQNFRGTGVWNYDNWRKDADERKRYFGGANGLQEDDKWIQKAVDPAHKGYCTPMTKDTCTPARKALAKRFKAGIEDESVNETDAFLENVRSKIREYDEGGDQYGGKLDQIKAEISQVKSKMDTGRTPQMFEKDGLLYVSGEDGEYFADYYGELSGDGYPTIDARLEAIADKYGMYWDWEDAGSIVLSPDMNEELGPELGQGEKFRAEVTGKGENRWSGNAMEYDTEEEAKEWLNNLANRWFGYDMSRVVPVSVPTGQQVDMENDVIYQNFRNMNEGKFDDYDDEDDPDAGHTVNGKLLSPDEFRKWKEEEGEYDDMDKQNRPRW